jgi:hypothetical protein
MSSFSITGRGLIVIAVGVLGLNRFSMANSNVIQWPVGSGGNGYYYERVDMHSSTPLTFQLAEADAAAMSYTVGSATYSGELAVLDTNYTAATNFISSNVMYGSTGTGAAPTNELYWVGVSSPTGNSTPNDANYSDWTWVNGSPVPDSVVSTWDIDHAEGAGPEGAGYFSGTSQLWDYIETSSSNLDYGYIVEFTPVPEPTSLSLLVVGGVGLLRRRRGR